MSRSQWISLSFQIVIIKIGICRGLVQRVFLAEYHSIAIICHNNLTTIWIRDCCCVCVQIIAILERVVERILLGLQAPIWIVCIDNQRLAERIICTYEVMIVVRVGEWSSYPWQGSRDKITVRVVGVVIVIIFRVRDLSDTSLWVAHKWHVEIARTTGDAIRREGQHIVIQIRDGFECSI